MYESEDDDFCCGRAWGASRVAVVSSSRYVTDLDEAHGVDAGHVWPASHCGRFVDKMSGQGSPNVVGLGEDEDDEEEKTKKPATKKRRILSHSPFPSPLPQSSVAASHTSSPLQKGLQAHDQHMIATTRRTCVVPNQIVQHHCTLRFCRTASHELGHCFGLDHCMYRACVMQGSASVAEDLRQPPYLCPVCEGKVATAILRGRGGNARDDDEWTSMQGAKREEERGGNMAKWKRERYVRLKACWESPDASSAFAPVAGWYEGMLEVMDERAHLTEGNADLLNQADSPGAI